MILALAYGAITLAVLPWASTAGPRNPEVILAGNTAIAFAGLCTALLFAWSFYREPRPDLLVLGAAYLLGTVMAIVQVTVFPGALYEKPLFGGEQTNTWVFLLWRLAVAILLLAAVALASREPLALAIRGRMLVILAAFVSVAALCTGLVMAAAELHVPVMSGLDFLPVNLALIMVYEAIGMLTLYWIWRGRAFGDSLYLWLAIVVVASLTDQMLSTAAGSQYTLGWNVSKASAAISSFTLLVLWLGTVRPSPQGSAWRHIAALGAAIGVTTAALLLRWFLTPWVGVAYPFATLFGAVAISVWIGGWFPATTSATAGFIAALFLFPNDVPLPLDRSAAALFGSVMYGISCAFIILLGETMRRLERQLRQRADELQVANRNKSRFLAMLSHELRNPLAPLLNGLVLLRAAPDAAARSRTRDMMERQVRHLRRLVDDLLDVSRIDQGKLRVNLERIALDTVLRSAVETITPAIEAKSQVLALRLPAEPIYVDADSVRFAQVVGNLLHNASKFTPEGGHIDLVANVELGQAVVRVIDDGAGFDTDDAERIFGMFVQGNEVRGATPGLGLGLTLARSLMQLQGGSLVAQSEGAGRGALFTCRLPLASTLEPVAPAATAPSRPVATHA